MRRTGVLIPILILMLGCTATGLLSQSEPAPTTVIEVSAEVADVTVPSPAAVTAAPETNTPVSADRDTPTSPPPSETPTEAAPLQANVLPDGESFELVEIAGDFRRPVYVTHAGDGSERLFVVEQRGVIWIVADGERRATPFLDHSAKITRAANEQGMLGLVFHPEYTSNGEFFVHYSDRNGNGAVSRFLVSDNPDIADSNSEDVILTQFQPFSNHNGGQLAFGQDGYLYIGLGDGGSAADPLGAGQDLTAWLGSILRIDVDRGSPYTVPPDNPFVGSNADPEIWAYGLRNPWRFSFDRLTGDLYIGDVGQSDWEEIDFHGAASPPGANFGWNRMEGNHCFVAGCDPAAYVAPVAEYHQSEGGCSITGGYVYRGQYENGLNGVYVYGDFCSGLIWTLLQEASGQWNNELFMRTQLNISSFGEDEAGELYVVDLNGSIYWLKHQNVP